MAAIAKNNAFGAGSPSWNLSFPEGNLTAAEILAYLPHWLKSVDVILRFVNNGGRSVTITYLLDKLRVMPTSNYKPNSTTVMMHYAMRRAGKEEWTIGTRHEFENDREYDENSLYVGDFRPPRLTHPKSASTKQKAKKEDLTRNWAADPIPFKDLALHVREHPSGSDALDLTRCVEYALKHPNEQWLFPTDFVKLVNHLGGPLPVTHSHLDKQLFARYDGFCNKAHGPERAPAKYNKKPKAKLDTGTDTETDTDINADTETDTDFEHKPKLKKTSRKVTVKNIKSTRIMRQTRDSMLPRVLSATPGRRGLDDWHSSNDYGGGKRRSSRRVKMAPVYVERDEDTTEIEAFDAGYTTPHKKRKLVHVPPTPKNEESDFEAKEELESDDEPPTTNGATEPGYGTPTIVRGKRIASRKARQVIQDQSSAVLMEQFRAAAATAKPAHKRFVVQNPEMMAAARAYEYRKPIFLPPPVLSANRMVIDQYTVYLYAQDGCRNEDELWASALSTYRFGGPRRHAPFRELYRLTEPMVWDTSDWAENIRWAKEQYREFGVETWTEYDDHLACITRWRMHTFWVSEEVVRSGM